MADSEKYPDGLHWDHSAQDIKNLATDIKKEANFAIKKIINIKGPRTYKNTIEPLSKFESILSS